ncbi:MAG TPA: hypothetical protein PKE38_16940 [Ignavibacteriaceae bacterium]|nr:hypothetical protein [Ignavibacteriaceae bacterium]
MIFIDETKKIFPLYSKEEFAKDTWSKTLPVMKTKAKLTEQEYLSIKDFLLNDSP